MQAEGSYIAVEEEKPGENGTPKKSEKVTHIADSVHESIPVSPFEKAILSTTVFNRLHNVLQTSTVYLTFPSARHSRFSHSLGCMHLAGRVYLASVRNSIPEIVDAFLASLDKEIGAIVAVKSAFGNLSHEGLTTATDTSFKKLTTRLFDHPFYRQVTLPHVTDGDVKKENLLLAGYQAARIAGLLHDVGHAPFSHVAEFALTDLYEELSEKEHAEDSASEKFVTELEMLNPPRLHEGIAEHLVPAIIGEASMYTSNRQLRYNCYLTGMLALRAMKKIVCDKKGNERVSSLHSLIDGTVDVDRMDFVSRDRIMTGLGRQPVGIERLVSSFQLVENPDFKEEADVRAPFLFLPSARSISSVEELLERRFDIYRYAVSHHRVKKTDGLLRRIIFELGKSKLGPDSEDSAAESSERQIPSDISGLWEAFHDYVPETPDEFADRVSQWDDAWLITVLRREKHSGTKNDLLIRMLNELLSGRKRYVSLFKRIDDFWDLDEAFLEASKGTRWKTLREPLTRFLMESGSVPQETMDRFEEQLVGIQDFKKKTGYNVHGDLLLARIAELFLLVGRSSGTWLNDSVEHALKAFSVEFNVPANEAFYAPVSVDPGVAPSDLIALQRSELPGSLETIPILKVSDIFSRLRVRSRLIPPFYVYLPDSVEQGEIPNMRKRFGELLWESFLKIVFQSNQSKEVADA